MSLDDYTEFLTKACYLHLDNPVEKWIEIGEKQQKIADFLNKKSKIRITGEKTDITFSVEGRIWKSCAGECNFPDGEVYTSPIENSAQGQIYFDFPQGDYKKRIILMLPIILIFHKYTGVTRRKKCF